MPEPELCLLFVRPLNQLGVRYVISGSVAAMLYGEPRLTHDVDFVVVLRKDDIGPLQEVFAAPAFYLPPAEVIALEVAREQRGHFNVIHAETGFKADFYTSGRDELHAWAFRHARSLNYRGEPVSVAPPEYVVVRKLEYFREGGSEKHLRDIRAMMAVSGAQLNRPELDDWVARRGLEKEWRAATA
jgi:hypothetical protein